MRIQIRYRQAFIMLILCAAAVLVFSLFISAPKIAGTKYSDKIEHTAAYMVLGFLFLFSFTENRYTVIYSILICTFYGGLIELLQNFTGRNAELADLLADFAGSAAGTAAAWITGKFVKKK